jgi:hypothetical protein
LSRTFQSFGRIVNSPPIGLPGKDPSGDPAERNRELPVAIGGQNRTRYLTPVLFAPHKNTANANPPAIAPLLGFNRTDRA